MAKRRKDQSPSSIKLKQADRSAPTEKTLLQLADDRGLFAQAKEREDAIAKKARTTGTPTLRRIKDDDDDEGDDEAELPPTVERVLETLLWSISLTMLHFTFDVLVQHQYSIDRVVWSKVCVRAGQAFLVFAMLVYALHPHSSSPSLLPGLPSRFQSPLRQSVFFTASVCAGCYLIHITNRYGYMAILKQAPSIGVLWVWSVIELDLPWAVLSLTGAGAFLWQNGYSIK